MARIIPKLNLNKTPQSSEDHTLVFAKNIKVGKDGYIERDCGAKILPILLTNESIKGIIPYNTKFYVFTNKDRIIEYDELLNSTFIHETGWKYSGGKITGNVQVNLRGETLLTVAEYGATRGMPPTTIDVPLKTINLNHAIKNDDESIYTQAPKVNIFNLNCVGYYPKSIPNGIYQFFIRYKISDNNYTNWIPASVELYAGNNIERSTNQGNIKYIDLNIDSDSSFILNVERLVNTNLYQEFQLGFIISHDDETYARAYKHYNISTTNIYFDYDTEFIEEIDIKDLLNPVFNIFNVKNITNFKNKQYISNYKESNFNPDLQSNAANIDIKLKANADATTVWYVNNIFGENLVVNEYDEVEQSITKINNTTIKDLIENVVLSNDQFTNILINYDPDYYTGQKFVGNNNVFELKATISDRTEVSEIQEHIRFEDLNLQSFYKLKNSDVKIYDGERVPLNILLEHIGDKLNSVTNKLNPETVEFDSYQYSRYNVIYEGYEVFYIKEHITLSVTSILKLNTLYNQTESTNIGPSLIPLQTYKFYVHYIAPTGEITNGYFIKDIQITDNSEIEGLTDNIFTFDNNYFNQISRIVIRPTFSNIVIPQNYIACFISVEHVTNHFIDVCNLKGITTILGDIPEALLRIYNNYKPFNVNTKNGILIGSFKHSGDSSNSITFGSSGKFIVEHNEIENIGLSAYIVDSYDKNSELSTLTKCTNFITTETCDVQDDNINLLGFVSNIKLLEPNTDVYVSGTDLFEKIISIDPVTKIENIKLENKLWDSNIVFTNRINQVYSRYNLTYLALQNENDFVPKTITQQREIPNPEGEGVKTINEKRVILAKDSLLLSDVYKVPEMYKTINLSSYSKYKKDANITTFNNTIRSSKLNNDESSVRRYLFDAVDYYNVPVNKGIITNLVAVGNAILVHTQDSLFKFVGNNSISANGGEDIVLNESEIFDTGITEVFGSQYGFGGLRDKKESLVTQQGYIYYDRDSNIIYMYSGEGQINPISDNIKKILTLPDTEIRSITFANDYYNDRIFVYLTFPDDSLMLSYNTKLNNFVSIHDFNIDSCFNTKTKCYFVKGAEIYQKSDTEFVYPIEITYYSKLYPEYSFGYVDNATPIKQPYSVIDVIYTNSYESIKILNSISWVSKADIQFNDDYNKKSADIRVAECINKKDYAGEFLYVYSDRALSEEIKLFDGNKRTSNDYSINSSNSYTLPRYNKGVWSLNYFRNVLDINDLDISDNKSLIYGKYFVTRFIFASVNCKFENITFNVQEEV